MMGEVKGANHVKEYLEFVMIEYLVKGFCTSIECV